jgi:hypothetical protein
MRIMANGESKEIIAIDGSQLQSKEAVAFASR